MITVAIFLAVIGSSQDFSIPPGASAEYKNLVTQIENAYVAKDFAAGSKLLSKLPGSEVTYHIEASAATPVEKEAFKLAIVGAAKDWQTALGSGVTFKATDSVAADIIFRLSDPDVWQWTLKPPQQLIAGFGVKHTGQDAKFTFAKYLGLGTARSVTPDLTTVRKLINLSALLRDSIQGLAPDFRVPIGSSSEFSHLVMDIETALGTKKFEEAEKLSALLPRTTVTWSFDSSKLNGDMKKQFSDLADAAESQWQKTMVGEVSFKRVAPGKSNIAISFEPILAKISSSNELAGSATFIGVDSTQARIETVIGLKRGANPTSITTTDVYNEILFAFGRYLGLAPSPLLGSATGRIEGHMLNANSITSQDKRSVQKIQSLSIQLRDAIKKRQVIESFHPILNLEKESIAFSEQMQGDQGQAQILVTNTGTSALELDLRGDCGCISGSIPSELAPGKSALLTAIFNTSELVGDVHHNLILKTNDPDHPLVVIPVSITVNARAEIVFPTSNTAYMEGPDRSFTFYVNSTEAKLFNVIDAQVVGLPFTVKVERYDGSQANYMKFGQTQKIHGYKLTVDTSKLAPDLVFGRSSATVYMRTDNPKLGIVKAQMFVQKGIVSLPESVYLGSPQGIADSTFVLIRLGRPFQIKKISSDSKFLSFEVKPNAAKNPSAFTIQVIYDGKAPGHRLKGTITVETDDPKQAIIKLPYQTNQT